MVKGRQYTEPADPGSAPGRVSIVIPMLDEARIIRDALHRLQPLRHAGHEVICVDGGSRDGTAKCCEGLADRVLSAPQGRALQMNAGAAQARGSILLFLHADTRLPSGAVQRILERLGSAPAAGWGFFAVRLDGVGPAFRVIERAMSLRSRLTGIGTGDQALFVTRTLFRRVGGFPQIPLMEDVALSRLLKRTAGRPIWISSPVTSSARYWKRHGVTRSVLRMWWLRAAFFLGADPARLHVRYYGRGSNAH